MLTLTDDELRRTPDTLFDHEHQGQLTVVTTNGQPVMLAVPLGGGPQLHAALLDLAVTLYDRELISLGKAAEIAGLSYSEMIDELGRRDIATLRLAPGQLERELAAFGP